MKNWNKFLLLGAVLAASTSFALADQIDLSGPGTFSGGIYTPGTGTPIGSQYNVTLDTGIFSTFAGATPVFYSFNDASTPTGNLFSVENTAGTENLTFQATSESILNSAQVLFNGELFINGVALSPGNTGFSENPIGTSGTENAVNIAATPEPASLVLLGTALLGMSIVYFRKQLPTV